MRRTNLPSPADAPSSSLTALQRRAASAAAMLLAGWMIVCAAPLAVSGDPPRDAVESATADPAAPRPADERALDESQEPKDPGPVDFTVDIAPIFARHCAKCHGPQKRSGGLRFDARDFAEAGGDSGKPILGGTRETNELFARVASKDRSYRMPKNSPALSDQEIERIGRWVDAGTPWAAKDRGAITPASQSFYDDWLQRVGKLADRYQAELDYARPYAWAFVALQLALFAIARAKGAYNASRAWTTGRAAWLCRWSSKTTSRELVLVWLLLVAGGAIVVTRGHDQRLEADLAAAKMRLTRSDSPWTGTIYGWPPVPIRPDHPKQVAGTYYRGNCERNPELFNNGNYLTAIFRVSLCDATYEPVEVGSTLPEDGLFVRLEIERAPGTTDVLFSKELMGSVFLSQQFFEGDSTRPEMPVVRLDTLEDSRRWAARFPIGPPGDASRLGGLIYVYTGRADEEMVRGEPHYGIKYDLVFADGKLSADSDLWMESFDNSAVTPPALVGKIPHREWFDYRPLPVIEGDNTTDPKLLGVEEYVRRGLIAPPAPPPAAAPPSDKAPADNAPATENAPPEHPPEKPDAQKDE